MKRLHWGILGTGKIVRRMAPAIQQSSTSHLLGISGRNQENSIQAAKKYGIERTYSSYEELIEDPDIDAVYIALLNHLHLKWAIKALEAGKHVLCEKPITLNEDEAQQIKKVADQYQLKVMEAFAWRFQPVHQFVKQIIDNGRIGEVRMVYSHFSFQMDHPEQSTRMVKEWGGGSLYDIGCYPLTYSRYFMGDEPEAVDARMYLDPTYDVDVRFWGSLYFPGGRTAQISSAFDMANRSYYEILGERGKIITSSIMNDIPITISLITPEETKEWNFEPSNPYLLQVEHFTQAILEDLPLAFGAEDGIQNMKIIDALFKAHQQEERIFLS